MIAFQTARRERDAQRSFGEWLRDSWRRTTRRQTQFSLVSAALADRAYSTTKDADAA